METLGTAPGAPEGMASQARLCRPLEHRAESLPVATGLSQLGLERTEAAPAPQRTG